ncbi:MAG TPA: sialidase family protein [Acidimicrobiales bacterium]|nr:sialidase family protein [Acidimicrobiales bacterium]
MLLARVLLAAGLTHVAPESAVTAMNLGTGPANNSPELVVDPRDPSVVVDANRLDAPDFSCSLNISGDGGGTWAPLDPVPTLPPGAEKCYAPEAVFDRRGVLYYLFVGLHGGGNTPMGAFITSSDNLGRTFSPPRLVLGPDNFGVRLAVDLSLGRAGRLILVWLHSAAAPMLGGFQPADNPILGSYSDDGAGHFSVPVRVSDGDRARVVAPALIIGPHHTVAVAYYDLGSDAVDYEGLAGGTFTGTWSIVAATSTDGGAHFGRGRVVDAGIVAPGRVMLIFTMPPPAIAAGSGVACIAWADARHGSADILARCAPGLTGTWGPIRRLNDDPVGNGRDHSLPRLAVSPQGRVDAIFLDRRQDPANLANSVFYTYSINAGRTWAGNNLLTRSSSDSRIGPQYLNPSAANLVEFGSRLGLVSNEAGVLAAWPDTRNSQVGTTDQDIFTTRVDLPDGGYHRSGGVPGAILLVVGLLMLAWTARKRRVKNAGETDAASSTAPAAAETGDAAEGVDDGAGVPMAADSP